MKLFLNILPCLLVSVAVFGQNNEAGNSVPAADTATGDWLFSASVYYFILPDENNTATLLGYADYRSIHLEARYNYEDVQTASVFGGYRLEAGNQLVFGATPMAGIIFGSTNGIAPGLLLDLSWKIFDFYAESEYVFDFSDSDYNYFYAWTEMGVTPFENFRTGIAMDRTRLYRTGLELQKGIFAQYAFWKLTAGVHYFNPLTADDFGIVTLAVEF